MNWTIFKPGSLHDDRDVQISRFIFYFASSILFLFTELPQLSEFSRDFFQPIGFFKFFPDSYLGSSYRWIFYLWICALAASAFRLGGGISSLCAMVLGAMVLPYYNNFGVYLQGQYHFFGTTMLVFCIHDFFPQLRFRFLGKFGLDYAAWPLVFLQVKLMLVYFAAGFSKIYVDGFDWFTYEHYNWIVPLAYGKFSPLLVDYPMACFVMISFGFIMELFSFFAMCVAGKKWWWIPVGLWAGFHIAAYHFFGPDHIYHILNSVVWVPWVYYFGNKIPSWIASASAPDSAPASASASQSVAASHIASASQSASPPPRKKYFPDLAFIAVVAGSVVSTLSMREFWPFYPY